MNEKAVLAPQMVRTFWRNEKCIIPAGIRNPGRPAHRLVTLVMMRKPEKKGNHLEDLDLRGRLLFKWIVKKHDGVMLTGFVRLKIKARGASL